LKQGVETGEDGAYKLENIPPGRYTILVHMDGFSDVVKTVVLTAGANVTLDFNLNISGVREQVTVTASGTEQSTFDSFQSVNSVNSNVLAQKASTSLGEVLEGETGVAKRSFGSGSARPVIRGFDGDRVLVAQDGVRSGSLGSQSGDHGEPVDTLGAERIEVVKGPATLLYGSNAIGGVVNVISNHEDDAHSGFRGFGTILGGTNNNQFGGSGGAEYGYKSFMVFGNGSYQRTSDYRAPIDGRVPNSAARSFNGLGGAGYYTDKAFFTGTFSYDKRRYGIPFAGLIESGFVSNDEEVDLRAKTYNFKANGGFRNVDSFVSGGKFTINYTKYKHEEIAQEDGVEEVGTVFDNKVFSYRGIFEQKPYQRLTGRFGFEGFARDYQTVGAEQLIAGKVKQNSFSVFGLEELKFGRVSFQFGGRVENNRYRPDNPLLIERDFTGFSGAAGVRVGLWEGGAFVTNFTSSYRAPALEELYNEGPHIGTVTFEIGDPNLKRERANGIDFGVRHQSEKVHLEANIFYYKISDFVFLAFEDEDDDGSVDIEDGLPVARYTQGDSKYFGAEFNLDANLNKFAGFFLNADYVRAKLDSPEFDLPRIPPAKVRIGLDLRYKGLNVRPEGYFVAKQDKLYPLETRTAGYGLFNVGATYTIGKLHSAHIFSVNGYNLFNKQYRNHLSFIKDLAPEIGRGVRFSYTVRFF
jgi:iron complex outermembrane receptor protein